MCALGLRSLLVGNCLCKTPRPARVGLAKVLLVAVALLAASAARAQDASPALKEGATPAESAAPTENDGQGLLDQATEAKITAESMADLGEVARLCREALAKGLDASNTMFAKQLLAGTLMQRAQFIGGEIFDSPTPPARWPELRTLALADLEQAIEANPDQEDAHFLIARLQMLPGGDSERALKAVNRAVELSDKHPAMKVKALLERASLVHDPASRRADLAEALKLAPRNSDALRMQGLFLLTQNEPEAALKVFDESLAINDAQPDAHEGRGMALFALKRYDDAMLSFDRVIELAPISPIVYTHLRGCGPSAGSSSRRSRSSTTPCS